MSNEIRVVTGADSAFQLACHVLISNRQLHAFAQALVAQPGEVALCQAVWLQSHDNC
jgi:hypothetical protein